MLVLYRLITGLLRITIQSVRLLGKNIKLLLHVHVVRSILSSAFFCFHFGRGNCLAMPKCGEKKTIHSFFSREVKSKSNDVQIQVDDEETENNNDSFLDSSSKPLSPVLPTYINRSTAPSSSLSSLSKEVVFVDSSHLLGMFRRRLLSLMQIMD